MTKKGNDLCGAGWIVYCRVMGWYISISLIERSNSGSSYCGELLGMLAIPLFLLATEYYHDVIDTNNKIHCDNMGEVREIFR